MIYAPKPYHNPFMHYAILQYNTCGRGKCYWNGNMFTPNMFEAKIYKTRWRAEKVCEQLTRSTGHTTYPVQTSQMFNMMRVLYRLTEEDIDRLNY